MSEKSKLIALVFNEQQQTSMMTGIGGTQVSVNHSEPDMAEAVLKEIAAKAKENDVKLEDAVIIFKTVDGKTKIKQTKDITVGKGAGWGSFWGLLVGLIVGGPLVGLLWGLGIGALYGGVVDHGIDDKFLKNVGNALGTTGSAVLFLIRADDYTPEAQAYLESYDAELHVADFSKEAEEAVLKAGEDKKVSSAVEAEFTAD